MKDEKKQNSLKEDIYLLRLLQNRAYSEAYTHLSSTIVNRMKDTLMEYANHSDSIGTDVEDAFISALQSMGLSKEEIKKKLEE